MNRPWRRLASWWRRSADDREHLAEVDFHLQMAIERHRARGLPLEEARRQAAIDFGSRVAAREGAGDARAGRVVDDALRDLRHGVRALANHPTFTLAAVSTLALAIGVATAVFSVTDHVLLRGAPYRDPGSLVVVWETDRRSGTTREPAALPDWRDLQRQSPSLESLEAGMGAIATLATRGADPIRVTGMQVSAGWFATLGVAPLRGRTFSPAEASPGGGRVALISAGLWRTRFAGSDRILGTHLILDDVPTEVVGIMPDESDYGLDQVHGRAAYHAAWESSGSVDVWLPLQAAESDLSRDTHPLLLVGRTAAGASRTRVQEDVGAVMARLERDFPRSNTGRGAFVEPLEDVISGPVRPLLGALAIAVVLLAVVASVNVAGLLLVRGAARAREVALRAALGASHARLTRQFAMEGALLVALGALAGLGVAWVALGVVRVIAPADLPRIDRVSLDGHSVAAACALAGAVGLICSLVPAWHAAGNEPMAALQHKGSVPAPGARGHRLRQGLLLLQLGVSVALAASAGLLVRSFQAVRSVDPGFRAANVVKLHFELPASRYPRDFTRFPNLTEINRFNERLLAEVRSVPGIEAATIAAAHPLDEGFTNSWSVVGREAESRDWPEISVRIVADAYELTMGQRLLEGRAISSADVAVSDPVAVINARAARQFFPSGTSVGQELSFWGIRRRIVGVVADERIHGIDRVPPPAVYVPLAQAPGSSGVVLVRSSLPADVTLAAMQRVLAAADPSLAPFGGEPFTHTIAASQGQRRFAMLALATFAVLTIGLALVGVHGVVSYGISLRGRELAIRMALGAGTAGEVGRLLRETLLVTGGASLLGVAGALGAGRFLSGLLFGVSQRDPLTLLAAPILVIVVSLLAAAWPAWQGVRRAPMRAMRG